MGLGTQDLLDQEPYPLEPHHFYLVSWHTECICFATQIQPPSHRHFFHFIDYFELSAIFLYKRITQLGLIDPHMP